MYHGERFNAYSHLIGALLAILATVLLVIKAVGQGELAVVAASVYGGALIFLYVVSTLYHSVRPKLAKAVLQKFDHCAIYLLIAGSYTPYALVTLQGAWGWTLFGLIWGLAAFGIVQEVTISRKSQTRWLSLLIYLVMGWTIVFFLPLFVRQASTALLVLIAAGGVLYTLGAWFYARQGFRYHHMVWHLLINLAVVAHFIGIVFFLY